jgi:excisionase family DNA binding protein
MKKHYTIKQAAELLGVSDDTLRRWETEGKMKPARTKGNHRRYVEEDLYQTKNLNHQQKLSIAYCRVSSADQKQDLQRQIDAVSLYCTSKGYQFKVIQDLGSGLNYHRKGFNEMLYLIQSGQTDRIVINYKDRLLRFGYEMLEKICNYHQVDIEIINHTEDKTFEQELVEDMVAIITVFSSRLYGSRSHKQKQIVQESKKLFNG